MDFQNELTRRIAAFLDGIGIEVFSIKLNEPTFLPGVTVQNGKLLVDEEKLNFPGDLLHEAGHLAVAPAELRSQLNDEVALPDAFPEVLEAGAIAWSYAACVYLEIDPKIVFHSQGYGGRSESLLFNFSIGVFPGVSQLEDSGLVCRPHVAEVLGVEPYPNMLKWLRS